jgi:hypothetical protein
MLMIFHQALYAFLISIFGSSFPCQEILSQPPYGNPAQELRGDKDQLIAQPLELIDGSYSTKK